VLKGNRILFLHIYHLILYNYTEYLTLRPTMEIFLLVILLILAIVANNRFGALRDAIGIQHTVINQLRTELLAFREEFNSKAVPVPIAQAPAEPLAEPVTLVVPEAMPVPITEPEPEPVLEPVVPVEVLTEPEPIRMTQATPPPVAPAPPRPSFIQRFLTENPDLEKFIGENLINKIGIAILVAGIGYFVKFAIDQQWINEIGRVLIGVLAGGLLLGVAHRLRHTFNAFSSVLVAGGLSVLYFTIAIAFSDYKIFSQTAAFTLMVVITGFSVLLAIAYNRSALAIMSLIGGFATPFMVSTGQGNYVILFSYLLVLDGGMLVLAYFKKWNIVHWVAYGFTVLLYGTWLSTEVIGAKTPPYAGSLLFASLFYVVFMAMNLINNLKNQAKFSAPEISLLLSNTTFYYIAGMAILAHVDEGAYQGLFTAAMALVNFGLAILLYRRPSVDRTLIYLLIGLVITFVSLTVPVQLNGNFITMFWALEAVLLLWLAQRSGLALLASGAVLIMAFMLISLTMDWSQLYFSSSLPAQPALPILLNKAFVTSLMSVVSLFLTYRLLGKQTTSFQFWIGQLSVAAYQRVISYLIILVIYFGGLFELDYQASLAYGFGANRTILLGTYHLCMGVAALLIARRSEVRSWMVQATMVNLIIIFFYILMFAPAVSALLSSYFQGEETSEVGFSVHYVSVIFLTGLLVILPKIKPFLEPLPALANKLWPWFLGFVLVYTVSSELFTHVAYFSFSGAEIPTLPDRKIAIADRYVAVIEQTNKVGLPILWGICAFAFMYVGLSRRNRQFRIMSLSLFGLTLLKLFLYDLQGISEGGRIAAFISLGALLLIISFMYQRIKRLILLNDETPPIA
jgi:uncharacterized membrane protein